MTTGIKPCPRCGQSKYPPRYLKCPLCEFILDDMYIKPQRNDSDNMTWEQHRDGNIGIIKDSPEYSEVNQ